MVCVFYYLCYLIYFILLYIHNCFPLFVFPYLICLTYFPLLSHLTYFPLLYYSLLIFPYLFSLTYVFLLSLHHVSILT